MERLIMELIERDDDKVNDCMPLLCVLMSENNFKTVKDILI